MAKRWHHAFGRVHRAVYRASGGRLGANLAGIPMLLLTTVGRKTGAPRTLPLAYMADGDDFVIVASNGGSERDPLWWRNLQARAEAEVQVGTRSVRVRAHRAEGADRARLWTELARLNRSWAGYAETTSREIPVVVLRPSDA